jgi:hypothetical protein
MRVREQVRLREGSSAGGGSARVVIITEGLGNLRDRNYYTADAIKSAAKILVGKQSYLNHPSESEEQDRPERSVRDLCGYFVDTRVGTVNDPDTSETLTACFGTLKFDLSESGQRARALVETALAYQKNFPEDKDVYCGISINAGGVSHPGVIDGEEVNMVTEIQEAFSADIVTKPARGGRFLALVESAYGSRRKLKQARRPRHRVFGTNSREAFAIFTESYRKQIKTRQGGGFHP